MKKRERSNLDRLFPLLTVILVGGGIAFLAWLSGGKADSVTGGVLGLDNGSAYSKGAENAQVVLTEFSDFQCQSCASLQPVLEEILVDYPGKVKLYYRHFPLPQHQFAQKAAEAAEAAGEQGNFWEMHDLIFENQETLNGESFGEFAQQLGLDTDSFNQALDSGKYRNRVLEDLNEGRRVGVTATPSLFINGKKQRSGVDLEELKGLIEEELEWKSTKSER